MTVLFRIALLLFAAAAMVGFGGMIAHGAYHARAFRSPSSIAGAVLGATTTVSKVAEYALYAVLPLGIVAVALSDDAYSLGDPWILACILVWLAVVCAYHLAIRPAVTTMLTRADSLPAATVLSSDEEAALSSRRLMIGEAATQLLLVVALVLVIWKPGA